MWFILFFFLHQFEEHATPPSLSPAVIQCNTPFKEKGALFEKALKLSGSRTAVSPVLLFIPLNAFLYDQTTKIHWKRFYLNMIEFVFNYADKTQHKCLLKSLSAAFKVS